MQERYNVNHPVQYRNRHRVLKIAHTGDISGEDDVKILTTNDDQKQPIPEENIFIGRR